MRGRDLRAHASGRLLGRIAGLRIRLVDGEAVRAREIRFTMGGHPVVYPDLVPRGEMFIDGAMSNLDVWATVLHEATEYPLMRRGMSYDEAHEIANAAERRFRAKFAGRRVGIGDVREALRAA